MIRRLVIFGASGDLTTRYLLPAVAQLALGNALPPGFEILGVAREDWTAEQFRTRARRAVREYSQPSIGESAGRSLEQVKLDYRLADASKPDEVRRVLSAMREPLVAYLALPPRVFPPLVEALGEQRLPEGSRIVVEKPFGEDLASARRLNRLLARHFSEDSIFRMDHFLGIQTAQNILGLRFGNRLWEPVWSHHHVERVYITWDETLTLEGRAGYYDAAGALKDMVQNHLLQLLCLVAMEPPLSVSERDLRDRKLEVLRAVTSMMPAQVRERTVRARYTRGHVGSSQVPAYVEEKGIDPSRGTETFAQVVLTLDNWRWAGVPFILRTGKALKENNAEIRVVLKPVPHLVFGREGATAPNHLRLCFEPERLVVRMNVTGAEDADALRQVELSTTLSPSPLPAYARLLREVLEGNPTFFIRADEAEESWRIVEPILRGWAEGLSPLQEYPAGSEGP
jgi:glucose-6-phosphate 1-dehydrogenase